MKKIIVTLVFLVMLSVQAVHITYGYDEINNDAIRSQLLIEALDKYGLYDPIKCANMWASGLKARSGAIQYSTLSKSLKKEYASKINEIAPNWVTGVSSPWVDNFCIVSVSKINNDLYEIKMKISTATSSGPYKAYDVFLTLIREDGFFRINEIKANEEFEAYMY